MKICVLCSVLFFLHGTLIKAAETFDIQKFITQQREMAAKNTSPQLHACTHLKDIETLLYQEEKDALNEYFTACNVPKDKQVEFHDAFEQGMKTLNSYHIKIASYFLGKNATHDTKNINADLLQKAKDIIMQYGLNPNRIDIIYDDAHFQKEPTCSAYATTFGELLNHPLRIVMSDAATIALNIKSIVLNTQTIAHEVTHIKEGHTVKTGAAEIIAAKFKKNNSPEIQKAFLEWKKNLEKQADLFPLLRLDNDDITKQLMQKKIADCLYEHLKIDPVRIQQQGSEVHYHPKYSELLPYIIKIQTLKNNGALSLYKKKSYQYSWYRYGGIGIVVAMGLCYYWYSYKTHIPLRITNH